ncbi:TPA: arginine--tRNA ligase [Candidatus Shapirobacteria bacterium]|uniref:Arginine--tRNA ligase n=2 Tax=Patescibacteria group TaxID=1783273 RepID=A0A1F6YJA3_9BACT|nr:MAG: arginine--tRNA ligase [Candidatus Nomurabacteria bacterium RIFOXYA1_FULL_35_17]HCU55251.1 arginine--tRNA ligase [Candidatus Shapirobacteria bacterium]
MIKTEIVVKLENWIEKALDKLGYKSEEIKIEHPNEAQFGDYSTNVALGLAKSFKTNPNELASNLKNELDLLVDSDEIIEKTEVAGAGFVNFYLKKEYLIKKAEEINYETVFRSNLAKVGLGKKMVIDYSAPNIAKPFGIGHLRSTNIGQAIYNIYKILGWNCIGDNHLGDWGTQFGKLIVAILKWGGAEKDLDSYTIDDLEKLYVKFHKEAEKDDTLVEEAREWFSKLENKDPEARKIWEKVVEISLEEFRRVYELLNVSIDVANGESFYVDKTDDLIKIIEKKGLIVDSQGAKIIEFENMPPAILVKSNGATTYFTRDMATVKYRFDNWKPDLAIYEVGVDQLLHFSQVFETAKKMGWEPKEGFVHVAHGLLRWKGGKFSTRKGDTIHLSDVIDQAMDRARELARISKISKEMTNDEKEEMVKKVAIGAIKFNDLAQDPKKDIIFDWDKVMNLSGDSGPYLQYTYARCLSVLDKTKIKETKNIINIPEKINLEEEALIKELYKFEEKIIEAAERFSPAVIAEYLLGVARLFNEFYGKHRIIDQKEEVFRLFLVRTTVSVLAFGLELLGIEKIEKM